MEYETLLIYLIFFLLPLGCMLPHLLRKYRQKSGKTPKKYSESNFETFSNDPKIKYLQKPSKPKSKDMLVLGELIRGVKKFDILQKSTNLDSKELTSILDDLKNKDLMDTKQKSGFFGSTVEIYATDKGFNEYYS